MTNNTIPAFFSDSDWSSIFNYFNNIFSIPVEPLSSEYIARNDLVSTAAVHNDLLSTFISVQSHLPNFVAIIGLMILFGYMYSATNPVVLMKFVTKIVQRLWLLMAFYYVIFLLIHFGSDVFNFGEILELNSQAYAYYVHSNQIYYSHILGFSFLLVLAGIHLFINSMSTSSAHVPPEVPVMTYLVACFSWVMLDINNFALLLVCLEGFSLTLYILATAGRLYGGISAAIKYFVFGTLGSILLYWGALSIFELTVDMNVFQLAELFSHSVENSKSGFSVYSKSVLAQSFILIGFLIKLGAAPLHQWVADVYAGVPLFITAFYSIFVKLVLLVLFLKFAVAFASAKEIEFAALFSLIVGCFGTLRQVEIKRFLAYGSIAHTGYLLMGDLTATYTYLATYILASFVFFSVLLSVKINGRELIYLSDLRFIGQSPNLLDRSILAIVLASMAGLPPFAGFYGKMLVWSSLVEDIYMFNDTWSYVLLLVNILTSLIMMFYYMQVMCTLYVNDESVETNLVTSLNKNSELITNIQCCGLALIVLWTFIMPSFLSLINGLL